jgi:hypothetical protein
LRSPWPEDGAGDAHERRHRQEQHAVVDEAIGDISAMAECPAIGPIEPLAGARGSPGVQPPGRFFHSPPVPADD